MREGDRDFNAIVAKDSNAPARYKDQAKKQTTTLEAATGKICTDKGGTGEEAPPTEAKPSDAKTG